MGMCRECDVVLWRRREVCPSCRARCPGARVGPARPAVRHTGVVVAVAAAAPVASTIADRLLRWALGSS